MALIILLAAAAVLMIDLVGIYNSFVAVRERVKPCWANIGVLLKQRHDELPKLIEIRKPYMQFEQ